MFPIEVNALMLLRLAQTEYLTEKCWLNEPVESDVKNYLPRLKGDNLSRD
jgi:hypothetical protein